MKEGEEMTMTSKLISFENEVKSMSNAELAEALRKDAGQIAWDAENTTSSRRDLHPILLAEVLARILTGLFR
jgi:hypothetical protein